MITKDEFLKSLPWGQHKRYTEWIELHECEFGMITGRLEPNRHELEMLRRNLEILEFPELIKLINKIT